VASLQAILALDLGTSSAKALVVAIDGTVLGRGMESYPTLHPREGFDEQEIEDWLQSIIAATAGARRFAPNAEIMAVGITGQMHGTVMLGPDGESLHSAVIWSDRRTSEMATAWSERLGDNLPSTIGGPIGNGYQALTLAWFLQQQPAFRDAIRTVLLPVDMLGFLLTGEIATTPSNAASTGLMRASSRSWDGELLSAFGIDERWLPEIHPEGATIGELTPAAADVLDIPAGIPVIHGGGDANAAAVATGVTTHDAAMITLSTGAQVLRPTPVYTPERTGLWHTWPSAIPAGGQGDAWLSVGALLNGGRVIDWIHETLEPGVPIGDVMDLAGTAPPGAEGLIFLPYLAGERSPLLDPFARGAFLGLTSGHQPQHLVRAVIEGLSLAIADVTSRMSVNDAPPGRIVVAGGGSMRVVRQILATVLGVALEGATVQDSSALGAARIAAHGIGEADVISNRPWGPDRGSVVEPDKRLREYYVDRLGLFREAAAVTMPIIHRLQRQEP
jgi:xylulokinase